MIEIRLATPDDVLAIVEISNHYARTSPANFAVEPETLESWRKSFRETSEHHPWLVAVDGDSIVGFAKSSPWKGRCAYDWTAEVTVYVHPDHHGRGIGRTLYARLFDIMKRQGWRTLLAGITLPNEPSVRLHESFGFRKVAVFEKVGYKFGRWWDVAYWEMFLNDVEREPGSIGAVIDALAQTHGAEKRASPAPR